MIQTIVPKAEITKLLQGQIAVGVDVVKTGPHRTVYRWCHPAGNVYVKHYKNSGWLARLRNSLRRCKAKVELLHQQQLTKLGIRTFDTVWAAQTRGSWFTRESFLVSREIENTVPLKQFSIDTFPHLAMREQTIVRQRLAVALGKLAGEMHAAKIVHHDFHAGNLLLQFRPDHTPILWVIDVLKVHVGRRRLSKRQMERNLALLRMSLSRVATGSDRMRFFKTYWRTLKSAIEKDGSSVGRVLGITDREAARRFDRFTHQAKIDACKAEDKKWTRPNRKLIVVKSGNSVCWGVAELGRAMLSKFHNHPHAWVSHNNPSSTDGSRHGPRTVEIMLKIDQRTRQCVYTQMKPTRCFRWHWKLGQTVQVVAPRCTAREMWRIGHALRRRGIDAPLPLLFTESVDGTVLQGFLLTETVAGAVTLSTALKQCLPMMKPKDRQRWLTRHVNLLAERVRRLHWWKFEHRCLDTDAILVAEDENRCGMWFQKLEAVRQRWYLSRRSIAKTLGKLNEGTLSQPVVRNTHRVRFLKRYLGDRFANEWKHVWRNVDRKMQKSDAFKTCSYSEVGTRSKWSAGSIQRDERISNERKAG